MAEARRRADRAGHLRFGLPREYGGRDGSHLWMAVIREHLAARGLGLHNDLQTEHSIVANHPLVLAIRDFGTPAQRDEFIPGLLDESKRMAFGLTEPTHGSDATHMETRAVRHTREGRAGWQIDGEKMWTTGMHTATHCVVFARTSGQAGTARGISAFLVPARAEGVKVEEYLWTFNMPTDHPRVSLTNVWVDEGALLGPLDGGLAVAQHFVHENRIRQAASSLGAGDYCVRPRRARVHASRSTTGACRASGSLVGVQIEMLLLIRKTAWQMDRVQAEVESAYRLRVSCTASGPIACCGPDRNADLQRHRLFTPEAFRHLPAPPAYRIWGLGKFRCTRWPGLFGYRGAARACLILRCPT
jgi:acyl-CoA dehydrogenase